MIIKGSSRAGPRQLGRHLQRTDTNERVEILELHSPTGSLTEALRDWQFIAEGTRGTKGLYHANIDPDARYTMTPEQWMRAVDVLEAELGLTGQPRMVVLHEKNDRQHIHVVWQRTNIETMTLVSDSNNYYAHERASLALEQEFGHEHVPGKHAKRDRSKPPPKAAFEHDEWQQGERAGLDPRARKSAITDIFQRCDSGQALRAALSDIGFILAQGDRRDFVLVDQLGQVHSLARQIKDVRAKELREFMADVDRDSVPDIDEAKALQRERAATKAEERAPEPPQGPGDAERAKLEEAVRARHEQEAQALRERQETERARTAEILDGEIAGKLDAFDAVQDAARERYVREHYPELGGLDALKEKLKTWLDPDAAVKEDWRRGVAREAYFKCLQDDRTVWIEQQLAAKQNDLDALMERHAQAQREHAARYTEELERYTREHDAAQRLMAEIEAQRQKDREDDLGRNRDGPDPPTPTR